MLLETEVQLDWLLCILHWSWRMCSLKEFHKGVLKQLQVFKVLYFSLRQKFTRLFVWKERKTPLNLSKLTHQKEWNGPSSKRHSLRCPWRCMLGVTRSMPYNLSISYRIPLNVCPQVQCYHLSEFSFPKGYKQGQNGANTQGGLQGELPWGQTKNKQLSSFSTDLL